MHFESVHIGCSGFFYKDWRGVFYPGRMPQRLWLEYYAQHFGALEINNTFYGLPKPAIVEGWYKRTPQHFCFAIKGSRYITHIKRLHDPAAPLTAMYEAIGPLQEKLGCILWQLPPGMRKDTVRLRKFVQACSRHIPQVMEFRHISWYCDEVYELLAQEKMAFCMVSAPGNLPNEARQTHELAYLRFHGKDALNWYRYRYNEEELNAWKTELKTLSGKSMYIFFNNDYEANAIDNARALRQMIGKIGGLED